jgi:hypothetical protein
MDGLYDEPRPGAPREIEDAEIAVVISNFPNLVRASRSFRSEYRAE